MSYRVRILVAIGGILVFAFIISSIRRSKMMIGDSVFWFLFSLALLIIGIFPEIFFALARTLHVASASNLAYLFLIGLLLIRIFQQDLKVSQLDSDSPYNARKVSGLIPGPICTVPEIAIDGVLNYQETDDLFFYAGPDGTIYYAKTNEEHDKNVQEHPWTEEDLANQ